MFGRRRFLIAATAAIYGGALARPALAASADEFIRITGKRAFDTLGGGVSESERATRFRAILTDTFDLPTIARFVIGRYWRRATKSQRSEYVALFEEFVVQAYSNRFKDLTGKSFVVKQARELTARDKLVSTEVLIAAGKPPLRVNWRVRGPGSGYRIVDVMVEGVSMSVTHRDEFAAVIRSHGGKVEGLLAALRRKTGK